MFLDSAPSLIEKIYLALEKNDLIEIANQIHGYKTKWIMMGMEESKDLAIKIEKQCREEMPDTSVIKNIGLLIDQVNSAINELMKI